MATFGKDSRRKQGPFSCRPIVTGPDPAFALQGTTVTWKVGISAPTAPGNYLRFGVHPASAVIVVPEPILPPPVGTKVDVTVTVAFGFTGESFDFCVGLDGDGPPSCTVVSVV